jgi:hypothetical protein
LLDAASVVSTGIGGTVFFHYGLSSAGGVWREPAVHIMATAWVLSGQCVSFPLLHHWLSLSGRVEFVRWSPRHAPTAVVLNEFDGSVFLESRETPFPAGGLTCS